MLKKFSLSNLLRKQIVIPLTLLAIALAIVPAVALHTLAASNHASAKATSNIVLNSRFKHLLKFVQKGQQPPTDAQCRAQISVPCYSPQEVWNGYNVTPLLNHGFNGKGQTIVIIDSFGSPTIQQDLHTFDVGFGLPDPPSFKQLAPIGSVPFDPNNSDQVGWAEETTLDVEWAHALAPAANIIVLTSPVAETEGVQGLPEFLQLEQYAVSHHLGNIVSQSWSATENTLFTPTGQAVLNQFNAFYQQATTQNGVTFFASSGDSGSANVDVNGNFYNFPTVGFPASSPYVTAVGGTSLYLSTTGAYQSETVWYNSIGASGGGISQYFKEPLYQKLFLPKTTQTELNGYRGLPDISYDADPDTGVLVYLSFVPGAEGYYIFGGTSAGSPQWAGILADTDQLAGHGVGFINTKLYVIGQTKPLAKFSFHDITVGNNAFAGVSGYNATPGWDAATGWGSPNAAFLAQELAGNIIH